MITERRTGQTMFGSLREANCVLAVQSKPLSGSALCLVQPDGTEKFIYIDDAGKAIIGTYAQFIAATGGTVIGTQT